MAAAPENTNALKHGRRSQRHGIVLAKLGRRFAPAHIDVLRLRRAIEEQVRQRFGGLSLLAMAQVNAACRLEQACRVLELLLRDTPDMGAEETRANRAQLVQWSCQRNNILAGLLGNSITGPGGDPWAAMLDDPVPEAPNASQDEGPQAGALAVEAATDAPESTPGPEDGQRAAPPPENAAGATPEAAAPAV